MKIFSGFVFIAALSIILSSATDKNKILWTPDFLLQWKDFTGRVKKTGTSIALTAGSIEYSFMDNKPGVFAYFVKNKSWYIRKTASDYLLRHEQYHFNIAELYARKIRKQIIESNLAKDAKKLDKAFKKNFREFSAFQRKYDEETNHSIIEEEQERWENEIDRQLAELDDFADPFVVK